MRYLRFESIVFISVLVISTFAAPSYAAEPVRPVAVKPLQQPIMLQKATPPSLCVTLSNTIEAIIQVAHRDMQKTLHMYTQPNTSNYITFPGLWELYYTGPRYREHVRACCSDNRSFSVQDQKAAGCSGSDTVNQCTDKLVKYCLHSFKQRDELREMLGKSQKKAKELSVEIKQLSEKLDQLMTHMP